MRDTGRLCVELLTGIAAGLLAGELLAQSYPIKPIRVIDAYPPGGGTDIVARAISPKFQESLGQPWIIDSRAGAQGIIGAEIASRAAPDGYTLLMFTTNFTIHSSIYKNLPLDFSKAFAPCVMKLKSAHFRRGAVRHGTNRTLLSQPACGRSGRYCDAGE